VSARDARLLFRSAAARSAARPPFDPAASRGAVTAAGSLLAADLIRVQLH